MMGGPPMGGPGGMRGGPGLRESAARRLKRNAVSASALSNP